MYIRDCRTVTSTKLCCCCCCCCCCYYYYYYYYYYYSSQWRQLHSEKLPDLYSTPHIIRKMKCMQHRWEH